MTTYHVGGLRFGTYRKDNVGAYINEKAISGDMFQLHRRKTVIDTAIVVDKDLHIVGDGMDKTVMHVNTNDIAFYIKGGSLHLSDMTIKVANQAMALYIETTSEVTLENVVIEYAADYDAREKYMLMRVRADVSQGGEPELNQSTISMKNCQIGSAELYGSQLVLTDCMIADVYGGLTSHIQAPRITLEECFLNDTRIVNTDAQIAQFTNIVTNYGLMFNGYVIVNGLTVERLEMLDNLSGAKFLKKTVRKVKNGQTGFVIGVEPFGELNTILTINDFKMDENVFDVGDKPFELNLFRLIGLESTKTELNIGHTTIQPSLAGSDAQNVDIVYSHVTDLEKWRIHNVSVQAVMSSTGLPLSKKRTTGQSGDVSAQEQEDALKKLDSLTGLGNVKKAIHKTVSMAQMNKLRAEQGLPVNKGMSLHSIFAGSAGTGKTTVARLYAQALFERGVTRTNTFVEATSKDLVSGYVGQTAPKTHDVVMSALGGLLFIDEAYSLRSQPGATNFNEEAVAQLIADMENHRDDLVVVLAGYTDEMKDFILNGNPGLQSRFTNWITFDDYSEEELLSIFADNLKSIQLFPADENARVGANESLLSVFNTMHASDPASTGNARFVRNFVQEISMAKDERVMSSIDMNNVDKRALTTFIVDDVYEAERILLGRHASLRS